MEKIGLQFKKISNRLESGRNRALKELGLTGTQFDLLNYLYDRPDEETTLSHIAAHFDIKHTSAIHVLKILEEKEYIRKEPTKRNPRFKNICLTEKSLSLMDHFHQGLAHVNEQMLQNITTEEQKQLTALLSKIYDNLQDLECNQKKEN